MKSAAVYVIFFLWYASATEDLDPDEVVLNILDDPQLYSSHLRPHRKEGPLDVEFNVYLRKADIDDINMEMKMDMTLRMEWNDDRLAFESKEEDSYVTILDTQKLWMPDPFFRNSINLSRQKTIYPEAFARVYSDGSVYYSTRLQTTLKCKMNLERFPHDVQKCAIAIASYGMTDDDVSYKWREDDPVQVSEDLIDINRFVLLNYTSDQLTTETVTGEYSNVRVTLKLSRIFDSYFLEWYLPCIFLVVVAWMTLLIPADAFLPRLFLTVAPMLTLAALNLFYTNSLASVPYTKASDVFTGISLLVIFLTLIHVIIGYYISISEEEETDMEKGTGRFVRFRRALKQRADFFGRAFLISFYIVFLFVYFIAYLPY